MFVMIAILSLFVAESGHANLNLSKSGKEETKNEIIGSISCRPQLFPCLDFDQKNQGDFEGRAEELLIVLKKWDPAMEPVSRFECQCFDQVNSNCVFQGKPQIQCRGRTHDQAAELVFSKQGHLKKFEAIKR